MVQRAHYGKGAGNSGYPVGETERRQGWGTAFLAERAECATRCVGAGLAKSSDPEHDQARIKAVQSVGTQAPLLQDTGTEVLNEHAGGHDEGAQDLLPIGGAKVECHAPLVAGDDLPPPSVAVLVRPVGPGGIAGRVLDLDDVV